MSFVDQGVELMPWTPLFHVHWNGEGIGGPPLQRAFDEVGEGLSGRGVKVAGYIPEMRLTRGARQSATRETQQVWVTRIVPGPRPVAGALRCPGELRLEGVDKCFQQCRAGRGDALHIGTTATKGNTEKVAHRSRRGNGHHTVLALHGALPRHHG